MHLYLNNHARFKCCNIYGDKYAYIFSYIDQQFDKDTCEFWQLCNKSLETSFTFTSLVLERFPDDHDGKLLLESIDTIIMERKKGAEGAKKRKPNRVGTSLWLLMTL